LKIEITKQKVNLTDRNERLLFNNAVQKYWFLDKVEPSEATFEENNSYFAPK
jgi:hypothetical protein